MGRGPRPDRQPAATTAAAALLAVALTTLPTARADTDVSLDVAAEWRLFPESPAYPGQFDRLQPSAALTGEFRHVSDDRRHQFVVRPFLRLDARDSRRTHGDLREGYYRYAGERFELLAGIGRVFWGVAESRHLVDVVNQVDGVEDIDEEDRLGQPMLQFSILGRWGRLDLLSLPVFRERTFPGVAGRPRFEPRVDATLARFGADAGSGNADTALRYSHYFGAFDVGVSLFDGTSREPLFVPEPAGDGSPVLAPLYTHIRQLGVDVQYTHGSWLWKFEGIVRDGQGDTFGALVGGFEYTRFAVAGGRADLGLLAEWLFDDRDGPARAPVTTLQNDLFYGARLALNDVRDSNVLAGLITDLEDGSTAGFLEARRRIARHWLGELEARFFLRVDDRNILQPFAQDSFVTLRFTRFF
jgi:hypothetical protein